MVQPPRQRPRPQGSSSQTSRPQDTLGKWENGRFTFDYPEAEVAWQRRACAQGVHPRNWHRGREVDADTAKLVEGGMAGAVPPFYRGPDGTPRFGNQHTIEPPAQRALRQRSFAGKTLEQIAAIHRSTGKLPGEDEVVSLIPGNDNQSPLEQLDSATVAAHSAAIRAGMQHARQSDPIEEGLEALGYQVGLTILPAQLKAAIMESHLASTDRSNDYPADPAQKSPAATMPWSLLSMP